MKRIARAISVAVFSWSSLASGAPSKAERADILFREGREAMSRHDYAVACTKFYASQKLDPAPGTLVNLGECEEGLGHLLTAWRHAQEAVRSLPAGDERIALARAQSLALEKRLARLSVRSKAGVAPVSVKVLRDGTAVLPAESAGALMLEPGRYAVLAVLSEGEGERDVEVTLRAGEARELVIEPQAGPTPEPTANRKPEVAPRRVSPPEQASGTGQRTVGFVLAGAGVVGLAVAGIIAFQASSTRTDALALCPDPSLVCPQAGRANDMLADASDQRRNAAIAGILGGVFVAGGLTLVLTAPSGKQTSVHLRAAPSSAGLPTVLVGGVW